jgi:hypothetical protein
MSENASTNKECPIQMPSTVMDSLNAMLGFVPIPHPPVCNTLYAGFLLPIEYLEKSQQKLVANSVADDLELIKTVDISGSSPPLDKDVRQSVPMYEWFCEPSNDFGKLLIPEMAKRYTTNIGFLEDTQKVVERISSNPTIRLTKSNTERFVEIWKEIKEDSTFLDRHSYMEYVVLEELNKSRTFLSTYSIMNLISPLYSLMLPLVLFLMPFVLLKIWNIPISFDMYLKTLRDISKTHFIGRILNIRELTFENVLYALLICGMYVIQTYSQITSCIKYHAAVKRMNENLLFVREYLEIMISSMNTFTKTNADLPYYSDFCQDVNSHKLVLQTLHDKIGTGLSPYSWTIKKISELGHMFDCYYQLYSCVDFESSLRYSVGFEGYMDILQGVSRGYQNGVLGKSEFAHRPLNITEKESSDEKSTANADKESTANADSESDSDSESSKTSNSSSSISTPENAFISQYYPPHKNNSKLIRNTVNLETNLIITGVNASGKTTTLKTTALNIIFTQQFGFGFYQSAKITPYSHIHSYLNIPDTSGRDSLFQAESRRCKEILDKIRDSSENEIHFCIFDELYSGTNPKEASKSAHSLLKFLSKKQNVRFILTTHYVTVCNKFRKSSAVKNYKMIVNENEDGEFVYTYKMGKGISTLEGGIAILKTMNYPAEIINTIEENKE